MVGDEHHIKVLRNVQAALVACVRSAFVPAIDEDCQQFQMHPDAIRQIEAATSAVEIRGVLANAGVPEAAIEAFASDLADATARGSVLRVTYPPDQTPVSDVGFLLLRARARLWTIKVDAASPNVTMVRTVDEASFAEQVRSLFDATE